MNNQVYIDRSDSKTITFAIITRNGYKKYIGILERETGIFKKVGARKGDCVPFV